MTQIVRMQDAAISTLDDVMRVGQIFAQSGFFTDAKSVAQATAKILAGRELGFGPIQSMNGIHIIQNRVCLGSGLMAAAIKRSGKYDYRIVVHTEQECKIEFFQYEFGEKVSIGESHFTIQDAQKASLTSKPIWRQYARNMLFSRAISNGQRWHTPDVFGVPVYTPEEMGADDIELSQITDTAPSTKPVPYSVLLDKAKSELNLEPSEVVVLLKELGYQSYQPELYQEMMIKLTAAVNNNTEDTAIVDPNT